MSSYTTLSEFANAYFWMPADVAEYSYGKDVAKQNRTAKHGTSYSIFECGEWREASPDEAEGIEKGLAEIAEAVAFFCDADEIEAMLADEWDCSCVTDEQSCPACRMAACYAYVSEQRAFGFSIM